MGLGVALAGCGYIGEVRAMKAFKDGNKAYGASDWRAAAEKYFWKNSVAAYKWIKRAPEQPGLS
jgi:hypothetical protein